ncbi:TolC family protein [Riemerella anatipestifer]|nr:TolC family protein [Riemerella anatipestifer]MDY3358732.1 TolC family protein [Riemerella anatipestifer]
MRGVYFSGNILKGKNILEQYKNNFFQILGISVNIPVFNKGNTKFRVEQVKINEEISKSNLAIKKQELLQNIQKKFFDLDWKLIMKIIWLH